MKLGLFIVASLCAATITAHADHAAAIAQYRKAYERESDPALLIRIAREFRAAGDAREALSYFCSYLYVDAAGDLADEASTNALALSAQLGNATQSDHDACSWRQPATRPAAVLTYSEPNPVLRVPPITKREVAGLTGLAGTIALFGLALYEGNQVIDFRNQQDDNVAGVDQNVLAAREHTAYTREMLFLAAGGAALITSGVLYISGRYDRHKAEQTLLAPTVHRGGGGLALGRRF